LRQDLAFEIIFDYIYVIGRLFTLGAVLAEVDMVTFTPYSTTCSNGYMVRRGRRFITGFSSILTGLNFIVTIHKMRAPGLTWFRLPLFIWAHYAASLIMMLGTPVIAITLVLLALERAFHIGIFDPALGGDPILFQHLFWFLASAV
jgi:cytochrome c oxidase subunit 1